MKDISKATVLVATLTAVLAASAARATTVLDDFNRPNSSSAEGLGPNWTAVKAGAVISSNQASGGLNALDIFNGGVGDTIEFDIGAPTTGTPYVAGVLNWDGSDGYFVKIQEQTSTKFNKFGFYHANNTSSGFGLLNLTTAFSTGHVVISVLGSLVTLQITPTGGALQTYTQDYGVNYAGTGIGLGFQDGGRADNFAGAVANVPEPATWAMLIAGFGGIGGVLRSRRRRVGWGPGHSARSA